MQLAKDRTAIHEMFGEKLAVGDVTLDEARVRLDDFMIKNLAYAVGMPKEPKIRQRFAAGELENQAKGKFRRYLVCRIPMDDRARRAAIAVPPWLIFSPRDRAALRKGTPSLRLPRLGVKA